MAFVYKRGMAKLSQIDRRAKCGSEAWYRLHPDIAVRWLSTWRRNHSPPMAGPKDAHAPLRSFARGKGLKPSNLLTIKESMIFQAGKQGKTVTPRMTERQIGKEIS